MWNRLKLGMALTAALAVAAGVATAQQKYTGPLPAKVDVLYLLHADNLLETEVKEAKEESRKDGTAYVIPGASSAAKTPLPEPIFLLQSERLMPERLSLYRMDVKNGNREIVMSNKKNSRARPLYLAVTKISGRLYRVEADQPLDNGEYTISPEGSNTAFCFTVY